MTDRLITNFDELMKVAATVPEKRVVVVNPKNEETFSAIADAQRFLKMRFLLPGDKEIITQALTVYEIPGCSVEVLHAPDVDQALSIAVRLAREGSADILMKGSVDTSTMMKTVLLEDSGLKVGRLLSDIFNLEFPQRQENKFVMITDGGMTLAPDLRNKMELIRNAVDVAHALGNPMPKVAVLSATEFVVWNLPSTLDAAALAKMNERGQIKGCIVDGPFALDNALSKQAAEEKGIKSPVAGQAEILVAANIESANSLAKSTTYFANLPLAHVIVGGKVP
ncbi:MAG: phosphate acyltransferase, partial [Bacteroidota bacterium]